MPRLRNYFTKDGTRWSVWRVEVSEGHAVMGMPHAWLLFQDEDGTERRRLVEFPPTWESLSDERLELLCHMATPAKSWGRHSPPDGMSQIEGRAGVETEKD